MKADKNISQTSQQKIVNEGVLLFATLQFAVVRAAPPPPTTPQHEASALAASVPAEEERKDRELKTNRTLNGRSITCTACDRPDNSNPTRSSRRREKNTRKRDGIISGGRRFKSRNPDLTLVSVLCNPLASPTPPPPAHTLQYHACPDNCYQGMRPCRTA